MNYIKRSDLIKKTGLTRRKLEYLDKLGILSPAHHTQGVDSLYDRDAIIIIREIQLLEECGFRLPEIKKILGLPDSERINVLQEQIPILEEKIQHLKDTVLFAKGLSISGNFSQMLFLGSNEPFDVDSILHDMYKCFDESNRMDCINKKLASISRSQWKSIWKECDPLIKRYSKYMVASPDTDVIYNLVDATKNIISKYLFKCHDYDLMMAIVYIDSYPSISKHIDSIGGKGCCMYIRKVLQSHLIKCIHSSNTLSEKFNDSFVNMLEQLFTKYNLPDDIESFEKIDPQDPIICKFLTDTEAELNNYTSIYDIVSAFNLLRYLIEGILSTEVDDEEELQCFTIIADFFKKAISLYVDQKGEQDENI